MTFVADSSAWIDYLNLRSGVIADTLSEALVRDEVLLLDVVALEVLRGLRDDERLARVLRVFLELPADTAGGLPRSIAAASNYRFLRSRGVTIRSTADSLIASYCIANDLPLLHNDRDFDPFERHLGLKVVPVG